MADWDLTIIILDANYATVVIEMLLYGGYTTLFYKCIQILNSRRLQADSHVNNKIFASLCFTLIVLYLIASINLATTIFCNYQQIILGPFEDLLEIENYYEKNIFASATKNYACFVPYNWVTTCKGVIFVMAILISDLFLVFRSYVVWNRRLGMATLPAVAFLADTALGILYIFDSKKRETYDQIEYNNLNKFTIGRFMNVLAILDETFDISRIGLFSVTLSLNICCTFLIGFQIWRTQRQAFKHSPQVGYLKYTLVTIIESGAIYSSWIAVLLATYIKSAGWDMPMSSSGFGVYGAYLFFQDTTVQIIAITFSIIILRIGQGVSTGDGKSQNQSPNRSYSHPSFCSRIHSSSPAAVSMNGREFQVQVSLDHRIWRDDNIELNGTTHTIQQASAMSMDDSKDAVKLSPEESV